MLSASQRKAKIFAAGKPRSPELRQVDAVLKSYSENDSPARRVIERILRHVRGQGRAGGRPQAPRAPPGMVRPSLFDSSD